MPTTRSWGYLAGGLLFLAQCTRSTADEPPHPLTPVLDLAQATESYVSRNIRDFTCILVKRESINGRLMLHQFLDMKVRHARTFPDGTVLPYAVYIHYLAPERVKGRKVLYVDGWNENKIRVQKGGGRFAYVKVNVDPRSDAAMREARYPITDIGIASVVARLAERIEDDIAADPTGRNTQVQYFENAKVSGRVCTQIRVRHPQRQSDLVFYLANVYVDDELHVPIRIEGYDWPEATGEPPRLLEEYTYMKLRVNVGLAEEEFSPAALQ